jgi:tubby-related protein 1
MFDNDLFNDGDKPTNTLDMIRQARNKKNSQPRQQNVVKQEFKANDDDDDFDHHFKNMKQNKEEAPQQLFDLLGDGNAAESNANNDFGRKGTNARQRLAGRGQQRTSQAENQNDNFLYGGTNGTTSSNQQEEERTQQNSNPFDVYNTAAPSNSNFGSESTTSSRPGTSTSMNARAKLAQMQKQRLAQTKNQNTAEGTLESNQMLRGNRKSNIYENSTIDFGKSKHQDFFYDPSQKDMGQSNLPELQKTNHVISYKADEISAFTGLKQSNFVEYEEPQLPTQQEAPKQNKRRDSSGSPSERSSPVKGEPNDLYSPLEEKKDEKEQSSDEEPTKEELKALEKQKKELNKQQDAEIGIARLPADPDGVSKLLHINTNDITDMKAFLMSPCPKGYRIECTIKRDRSGISNKFYPKYHCYISNGPQYLMSAKKRANNKTSNYLVSYNKNEVKKNSPYCLGKVRSNFLGTEFNIYDHGLNPNKSRDIEKLRANLGVVLYESNLLSAKGPRKMRVLTPEWEEGADEPYQFKPLSTREGILSNFKCGKKNGVKEFFNKNPTWNEQLQAFVLNFNGRVEKPSVKNFQMIDEQSDKRIYLQFGRVTNDTFNMDFEWPLTPFQAFTICLSSFDYKIACE